MRRAASVALLVALLTGCRAPLGASDGPLDPDRAPAELKAVLPPLASMGENALRVQIAPSFSDFSYAIDYAPQPKNCLTPQGGTAEELAKIEHRFCRDVLVTYHLVGRDREEKAVGQPQRWVFHLPVEEWRNLVERLDGMIDTWRGERFRMTDGTPTAVERIRDGHVRSLENNFATQGSPLNPAYLAQTETQRLLLLYGPSGRVPRADNWSASNKPDPDWPCDNEEFATPDPDGWGVGNDACAQRLDRK